MDKYTKFLLTVITVSVSLIAVKMYFPYINQGDLNPGPVTFLDFYYANKIKDIEAKKTKFMSLAKRLPLVRVQGGEIQVSGSVDVDKIWDMP
jgi:hypothetical protein